MAVERTALDNSVTVLSERVPHLRSVSVGVWVPVGSRQDPPPDGGIAHFIEHMLFKGTSRRSALDIARAIESVGGSMNACTDREYTFFFVKALGKDFPLAVDLLADVFLDSVFDAEELSRERDVILQEILMVEDNPEDSLADFFHESFWRGHPLGAPVQGTTETVSAFTRDRVMEYFRDRFRRRGVVVSVVGNLPHADVVSAFSRLLDGVSLGNPAPAEPAPEPRRGAVTRRRPLEQLHLCLGAPSIPRASDDRFTAHVLTVLLGGSMSSRLFQEVREKRGLAYSIGSSLSAYADAGILAIGAGTSPEKAPDLLSVTGDVVDAVREGRFDDSEVDLARELIKGGILLSLENPEYRMTRLALNEMFLGRDETVEETIRGLEAVTPERVRAFAAAYLRRDRFLLAALGELPSGRDLAF
ncbi:MAG: insulinase family protein [Deltaproteobacteria bacterium]|nr:insulinase family protein [Deltaproteobacteria bacterium]